MAVHSPLNDRHRELGASFLVHGAEPEGAPVVETYGEVAAEYAALRKGCLLLDLPQRGTIEIAGADRIEFLQRMLTQELADLEPWRTRRSFWLNRKGRIDADLRVLHLPDRALFDIDVLVAPSTVESLGAFLFAEDVEIADATAAWHRLALHGPAAAALLADVSGAGDVVHALELGAVAKIEIAGADVLVDRQDETGELGLALLAPVEGAGAVHAALAAHARFEHGHHNEGAGERHRLRLGGWHAYNIARIEAGWPLFQIDFGPASLPHETGVLHDRVSFRKGCYLGQEVVARMESLGRPKQVLAALRIEGGGDEQPVTGAAVRAADAGPESKPIGGVTSSACSPMLGGAPICFAQLRTNSAEPGTRLLVDGPAGPVAAEVRPELAFWRRGA